MSYSVSFFVDGEPKGQPRGRAFKTKSGHIRVYDPGTAEGWKSAIAIAAKTFRPPEPLAGPVLVRLVFLMPRPMRLCRKNSPIGELPMVSKPDIDNLAKAVLDALSSIGMWVDDAQVWGIYASKMYHAIGGRPGVTVTISTGMEVSGE